MVLAFTPPYENGTCARLEEYEASRPPRSALFVGGNFAAFALCVVIWLASLVWCWFYRYEPHMKTVRPFRVNVLLAILNIFLAFAFHVNMSVSTVPCALYLIIMYIGMGCMATYMYVTITIFIVESYFSMNAGKNGTVFNRKSELTEASSGSKSSYSRALSTFLRIAIGDFELERCTFQELLVLKKAYGLISFVILSPICIPVIVIFALAPTFVHCSGCSLFMEPLIGFIGIYAFYILAIVRLLWIARSMRFVDRFHVFQQLVLLSLPSAPIMSTMIILNILDLDARIFRREYMYLEWTLQIMLLLILWPTAIGLNMYYVYRARRERANRVVSDDVEVNSPKRCTLQNMFEDTQQMKSIRDSFENYLMEHYASENLYFIEDVRTYKSLFPKQTDAWRTKSMRKIVNTYIDIKSHLEVNISDEIRNAILDLAKDIEEQKRPVSSALTMFDAATTKITTEVMMALWNSFNFDRPAKSRPSRAFFSLASVAA